MAYYLTRVELHHATALDYEALHGAMQRRGFARTVVGDDGYTYHLPTAEYLIIGRYEIHSISALAAAAAAETGRQSAVIVGAAEKLSWRGLIRVANRAS